MDSNELLGKRFVVNAFVDSPNPTIYTIVKTNKKNIEVSTPDVQGLNQKTTFQYTYIFAIEKFKNNAWYFIPDKQQVYWMESIKDRDTLIEPSKLLLRTIMSRKLFYYTLDERPRLNTIRKYYK